MLEFAQELYAKLHMKGWRIIDVVQVNKNVFGYESDMENNSDQRYDVFDGCEIGYCVSASQSSGDGNLLKIQEL